MLKKSGLVSLHRGGERFTGLGGLDAIKAFADIGVSRVIVPVFALEGDPVSGLARLGEDIIAKL